jgi:hypothetical protein
MGNEVRQGGNDSNLSLVVARNMARISYRGALCSMGCRVELHELVRGRPSSHLGGRGHDEAVLIVAVTRHVYYI